MMRAELAAAAAVLGLPFLVTPAAAAHADPMFWSYGGHNLVCVPATTAPATTSEEMVVMGKGGSGISPA